MSKPNSMTGLVAGSATPTDATSAKQGRITPRPAPPAGLEGVIAADTRLSRVDGDAGELLLAGYRVEALAGHVPWEAVLHLLWWDRLPGAAELASMRAQMAAMRRLPAGTLSALRAAGEGIAAIPPIDALILACATLSDTGAHDDGPARPDPRDEKDGAATWRAALRLAAALPAALAAFVRLRAGLAPLPARDDLGVAGNLLWQLHGEPPSAARIQALDSYLVTTSDHGLNASTFTARVIASTGAAPHAALAGAIGALSGWRHGGAPGPVLEMLRAIDRPERAKPWLEERLAAGRRIMGFGHRVYRVRDPRAAVLRAAVDRLRQAEPPSEAAQRRMALAEAVESEAAAAIARAKPGRAIHTNVEFYTAILLDALDIEPALFTPLFAVARSAGWLAHAREAEQGRLVRPRARYLGATDRVLNVR